MPALALKAHLQCLQLNCDLSTMSSAQEFYDFSLALQTSVYETNKSDTESCRLRIAKSATDGVLHTFGSGHSQILATEIERRAGGLVPVSSIYDPADGWPEQIVGYGARLFQRYAYRYAVQRLT